MVKVGDTVRHLGGGWLATVTQVHPQHQTVCVKALGHTRAYDAEFSEAVFEVVNDEESVNAT